MFEPELELSDNFRYVIENMPTGPYNNIIDKYIQNYILEYFGYTYITEILLGGIAQQTISIDDVYVKNITSEGQSVTHKAKASFFVSLGGSITDSSNNTEQHEFTRMVKTSYTTTLGGEPFEMNNSTYDWYASVADNPVVTHFVVAPIVDLLTSERFPNDSAIGTKATLIQQAWEKYTNISVICFENCSAHGLCQATGYFNFGLCLCQAGWTQNPLDCSVPDPTTTTTSASGTGRRKKKRIFRFHNRQFKHIFD